jgi:pyruvate/2-oxoglutarate dehydrogenase complex dihydrolipoamide acyltransferase (E2) component
MRIPGAGATVWAISAVLAVGAAGCGDDDQPASTTAAATAPATTAAAAAPAPAATTPAPAATTTEATPPPATTPEAQQGGAGDEEGNAVPVRIALGVGNLGTVEAPAFLSLSIRAVSEDGQRHTLHLATKPPLDLPVGPGQTVRATLAGQQRGSYAISVDGVRVGTLHAG